MWQELREELWPQGLEIVTVALDTGGIPAAHPWIEAAKPRHPALIDQAHSMDARFGVVNVPSGIWINEKGVIVRPPETAYPRRPSFLDMEIAPDAAPDVRERITLVKGLRVEAERYIAALRDWVARGDQSSFALSSNEVIRRSRPRPFSEAEAAAHFEMGQHLHLAGKQEAAITHFRAAYHLHPDNWTYKRQAWNLLEPGRSPADVYNGDWLSDVRKIGAENYYTPLDM